MGVLDSPTPFEKAHQVRTGVTIAVRKVAIWAAVGTGELATTQLIDVDQLCVDVPIVPLSTMRIYGYDLAATEITVLSVREFAMEPNSAPYIRTKTKG